MPIKFATKKVTVDILLSGPVFEKMASKVNPQVKNLGDVEMSFSFSLFIENAPCR